MLNFAQALAFFVGGLASCYQIQYAPLMLSYFYISSVLPQYEDYFTAFIYSIFFFHAYFVYKNIDKFLQKKGPLGSIDFNQITAMAQEIANTIQNNSRPESKEVEADINAVRKARKC